MNKIWIISDTHFGHENILQYCPNRQFNTINEHDEYLIKTWNAKVLPNDTVFHLGDFAFGLNNGINILSRLNGKKVLIAGNHDQRYLNKSAFRQQWTIIHNGYFELKTSLHGQNVFIVLCHYPLETWNKQYYGTYHFHGHCHSTPDKIKPSEVKNRKDVGIDSRIDLSPYELSELILN